MRIVVYGPQSRVGALAEDQVIDLENAVAERRRHLGRPAGEPLAPGGLLGFIEGGRAALDEAEAAIAHLGEVGARGADGEQLALPLAETTLTAPWAGRRIACVGGNYAAHLRGMEANMHGGTATRSLEEITTETRAAGQWGFWKVLAQVAGPGDEVTVPRRTEYFDYEGEAAIVIGRAGKDIAAASLADHLFGVTLVNDWSIRDGLGAPRAMSYNLAKNFDRSASVGPVIVVGELDPQDVVVETRVNGDLRQSYSSKEMIFSFAEVLEWLSRDLTFLAGDLISGGTGAGTAADLSAPGPGGRKPHDLFVSAGDEVEVSSPAIGTLKNRLVAP